TASVPNQTPQTASTSFTGATLSDGALFPPDSMGAAGPTQFLVGVNNRMRSFAKATGVADGVLDVSLDAFFASVRNGSHVSDPRVRFDRLSGRWIISAVNVAMPVNRILVA